MMRFRRIMTACVLTMLALVTYQQKNMILDVQAHIRKIAISNLEFVKTNANQLDLSILQACGIVTDGIGWGSCVAIAPNIVVTAGHCIGRDNVWVEINGVRYEVLFQWKDSIYDVGFIRIDGEVSYVEKDACVKLSDTVYLISSPYNRVFINTITKGIVSGLDRTVYDKIDLIQVDAEAAPGSSGGPLLTSDGKLAGICVAGPNPGGGVTLCVPVVHIEDAYKRFQDEGLLR